MTGNQRKPELLATASSLRELQLLAEAGADAFVIGDSRFGVRPPGEFGPDDILEAVRLTKDRGIRIYAAVNNLLGNEHLPELPEYLRTMADAGVSAVVFGDPAVLACVRAEAPELALHWNAEMTSTNYVSANYWGRRGARRAVLARELNLEQIAAFKANTPLEVQVQVHGMTNIYHSGRSLVQSYLEHRALTGRRTALSGDADATGPEAGLYLVEAERPGERFPIYEDRGGTHIMSSDDLCMLENLHELMELGIDAFKVETLLKPIAYNEAAVRAYRTAIDAYAADPAAYRFREEWLDPIRELQDPARELSFGFYYKEQVY